MKQKIDNSSGFTLIEVLIAAIILLFGLLAMGTFLGNLVTKNSGNERKTMATSIAEQQLENLRTLATQVDLTAADGSNVSPNVTRSLDADGNDIGPIGTAGEIYRLSWVIDEDFTGLADRITVTADWDATGNSQVVLVTLINN